MDRSIEIRYGPPGTGKTTSLIATVKEHLDEGFNPKRVAFTSFTRMAAEQGRKHAGEDLGLTKDDLPHFRTLHSMAFRALGLSTDEVMDTTGYRIVAEACGLSLTGNYDYMTERVAGGGSFGDECLRIHSLSKARGTSLLEEWQQNGNRGLQYKTVKLFADALDSYKKEYGVIDFMDMIELSHSPLDVDVAMIDEAQDLTLAQWNLARRLFANCPRIYIGGDDDQALYTWAGASSETLVTLEGTRRVLPHSYRLPARIKLLADQIRGAIRYSIPKQFSPKELDGDVRWISDYDEVDLRGGGSWLLMARHRYQLKQLELMARAQGVVYMLDGKWSNHADTVRAAAFYERLRKGTEISHSEMRLVVSFVPDLQQPEKKRFYRWDDFMWPWGKETFPDWHHALRRMDIDDVEYIRSLRRNGESLVKDGRVVISTIHAAKGGEAQNTLLVTDITSTTEDQLREVPDNEHRVWYVGVTRASERLFLRLPHTSKFWSIPVSGLASRINAQPQPDRG